MLSRTSHDSYEEGKDCSTWDEKIDWTRSDSFTYLSPVSSSESDVPPPPPTSDESDSSYSTFAEQASTSSFDNNDGIDDGATNSPSISERQLDVVEAIGALALIEAERHDYEDDGTAGTCDKDELCSRASISERHLDDVEVIDALALLAGYEEDFNDNYNESVEAEIYGSNNNLESFVAVLGRFAMRCSFDHWECVTEKETEKQKHMLKQQACLLLKRATARHSFLRFKRIVWQENVIDAIRQRKLDTVFRSWRDVITASNMRRKVYFLMMIFNRWRVLTEENVSMRQKKYAALMHWAKMLMRKSFSALSLHAVSQREEREHFRDRYQPQTFRSSFRSPEQSFVWSNRTPDFTKRLSFSKSAHKPRIDDHESRFRRSGFASSRESFAVANMHRTSFDSISPSARINKHRFQELGQSQKASYSSYQHDMDRQHFSSETILQNSQRMSISQPSLSLPRSANQDDCTIPFGCEADDIV